MTESQQVARLIELGRDREAAQLGAAQGEHMKPLEQLDELIPLLTKVVGNITPGQLDNPTPCAKFAVRDILSHMVNGGNAFAAAFRGQDAPAPDTGDDLLGAFGPAMRDLQAAMHEPGALDRTVAAPFGEVPGETFARFVVLDGVVHGWDLSTATGQSYAPPDHLVTEATTFAKGALDPLRDGDTFASASEAPPSATPIERLVAYTGRQLTGATS